MKSFSLVVIAGFVAAAATVAQTAPPATTGSTATDGPRTTRAYSYYDCSLGRVVLVGGPEQPRASERDHAWSWSGSRWEPLTTAGPTARGNGAVAYDAARGMAVLNGGAQQSATGPAFEIVGDTWAGTSAGWQRLTGADLPPRDHHAMTYDDRRKAVVMFGGIPGDRSAPWPSDTWELTAGGWTRIATEGPAGRGRTALVYDTTRRQVVLFGGVGAAPAADQPQPFFGDTWVLEGTAWRKVADAGPRARYAHGIVFDERAGVVLLYSGAAAHRDAPLEDMWQWDGTRWTESRLSGPTPGYWYQPVMAYDRARGRTVLYGGIQGSRHDTWEWDGRQWTEVAH